MIALALVLVLAADTAVPSKAGRGAELVDRLKGDIAKTDRAILVTEQQIARSLARPYAPELQFRLAELYVEKGRYLYLVQQEALGSSGGSVVAPETRLVKQKAIDIYERILRDTPDWPGCDRARFYLAHEYRELGQFDRMLTLEDELFKLHGKSPLAAEAMMIVGDHWFAAKELGKAEEAYQKVLGLAPSPVQDLARFKMGWVRLNQGKHPDAVTFFEAAAASPLLDDASQDVLSVKREALFDLVFSYTEARPWKGAVDYFEKLSGNHAVFLGVLEKLANRYFIKQEPEPAAIAYRRLVELSRNPARDPEFGERLHASLTAAGDKVPATAQDVKNLVRIAARTRTNERMTLAERRSTVEEYEIFTRDLATKILLAARTQAGLAQGAPLDKPVTNRKAFSEAADALGAWLELFSEAKERPAMMRNRADALFAAERWHEAGRAFEALAALTPDPAAAEEVLFDALAAYFRAEQKPELLNAWQLADARHAVGQLGSKYVSSYPQSPRVAQVKFQVARAAYDEGAWARSAELFNAYCDEHPDTTDTAAAADLALDALHIAGDFEGLDRVGRALVANTKLAEAIRKDVAAVLDAARKERLSAVALTSGAKTGDAAQGLVELAQQKPGTELGEQALHAAFATYREKKDFAKVMEVGARFLEAYPQSARAADVLATQARLSMELADYDAAAKAWEALRDRFPDDVTGQEAARTAATLYLLVGQPRAAVLVLEKLPVDRRVNATGRALAEARLAAGDAPGAEAAANAVLAANPSDAEAGVLLGRALLAQNRVNDAANATQTALRNAKKGRSAEDALARLNDVAGDAAIRLMVSLPADPLDPKVAALKSVQESSAALATLGATDLAVEGLYRLAVGFDHLATTLGGLAAPPKLSKEDREKFLAAVAQQATGVRAQADQAFAACAQKGKELHVFEPFVAACAQKQPLPFTSPPTVAPTTAAQSDGIAKARAELIAKGADPALFEALALEQIAAGDARRARLSFQRALELADTRASAQAGLGVVFARLGDYGSARDAYRRALELDPTNDRAHAGLAALYCRFGNTEQGRVELGRARQPPAAGAPDADPALAQCGGR